MKWENFSSTSVCQSCTKFIHTNCTCAPCYPVVKDIKCQNYRMPVYVPLSGFQGPKAATTFCKMCHCLWLSLICCHPYGDHHNPCGNMVLKRRRNDQIQHCENRWRRNYFFFFGWEKSMKKLGSFFGYPSLVSPENKEQTC